MEDLTATVRGLTIGCGTAYDFAPQFPQGVLDSAEIRTSDSPRPRRDGVIPGADFSGGKRLEFVVRLIGTLTAVEQSITVLRAAFAAANNDERLDVRFSGAPAEYSYFGRCRGIATRWLTRALPTVAADVLCTFRATDPTAYGAEQVTPIGLAAHPLPQTLPFTIGYHDSEIVNNPGKTVDRWTVEFEAVAGPLINPSIKHVDQGLIVFSDLVLASGDTLVLDGFRRRALLNGVEPVIPTIAQWWKIAPGPQEIRFAGSASSSLDCTATLTWRPGW